MHHSGTGRVLAVLALLCLLSASILIAPEPALALSPWDYFSAPTYSFTFSKTNIQGSETFTVTISGQVTCIKAPPVPGSWISVAAKGRVIGQLGGTQIILNSDYAISYSGFPDTVGEIASASVTVPLSFPDGSPAGSYSVIGLLAEVKATALVFTVDITGSLPSSMAMGTITYQSTGSGGGSSGGGGSFGASDSNKLAKYINATTGTVTQDVVIESVDSKVKLTINENTLARSPMGSPLLDISITAKDNPPPAPDNLKAIGFAYEFSPAGATFEPPISLCFTYDKNLLLAGADEKKLFVAVWDEKNGRWTPLDSIVDIDKGTVTAQVSHFSVMTVLLPTSPAAFNITDFTVTPDLITAGESATVTFKVTNTGDLSGEYQPEVKIHAVGESNEQTLETKTLSLASGDSEVVTLMVSLTEAKMYLITTGDMYLSLSVKEKPVPTTEPTEPTPATLAPAAFTVNDLQIAPLAVMAGEDVTIAVLVANTGDLTGQYDVVLRVDDQVKETRPLVMPGKSSQRVSFTLSGNTAGIHHVSIAGSAGAFTVQAPVTASKTLNWWLYGGIAVAAILGLAGFFILRQKSAGGA